MIIKKTKMISLRMTEYQYDKMMDLMQTEGYHSRTRFIIDTVLKNARKNYEPKGTGRDAELYKIRKKLIQLYREMSAEGKNLNQITKAINRFSRLWDVDFTTVEKLQHAITMAGYVAEKLTWRSRDVHEIAVKIECDYCPNDEYEDA
ncbi:MAG: plasmid mobilization relaxosome protein MobC [Bacteroidales bacterium]|nr:plasmid mobilization relaxosome protein MobC [Bacteroidales bacterium]MBQ6197700.1 plasmid mobilization relaxosome protein MobC [Bacteroidales bacterium]